MSLNTLLSNSMSIDLYGGNGFMVENKVSNSPFYIYVCLGLGQAPLYV